jgi:hypothetical protein
MLTGGIVIRIEIDNQVGCGGVGRGGINWDVLHCQPSSYLCRRCRVAGPLLPAPWGALVDHVEHPRPDLISRPLQHARMACPSLRCVRASAIDVQ